MFLQLDYLHLRGLSVYVFFDPCLVIRLSLYRKTTVHCSFGSGSASCEGYGVSLQYTLPDWKDGTSWTEIFQVLPASTSFPRVVGGSSILPTEEVGPGNIFSQQIFQHTCWTVLLSVLGCWYHLSTYVDKWYSIKLSDLFLGQIAFWSKLKEIMTPITV